MTSVERRTEQTANLKTGKHRSHHFNRLSVESAINTQPRYDCFPPPFKPMSPLGCGGALMDHITGKMCRSSGFGQDAC